MTNKKGCVIMGFQKREIRNLIMRIVDLAFRLNSTPTTKETTGDKPTVFVDFFGHTTSVDVIIYPHGWDKDSNEFEKYSCYPTCEWDSPDALYNAVERLEELYQEWGDSDEGGGNNE